VFNFAIAHQLVTANPFKDVPVGAVATKHLAYISEADAARVLPHLPSIQWKLLFALSRWGGLRVPSEPALLTWADVDWDGRRLSVPCPKTAHQGRDRRAVPMFPELVPLLREAFEAAAPGATHVLSMLRRPDGSNMTGASLRKPLFTAVRKAGLSQWRRLWHNLRSSRQTDLEKRHSLHLVCNWLGNTPRTAAKHYLQMTEADFDAATGPREEVLHEVP
jgi:integrase